MFTDEIYAAERISSALETRDATNIIQKKNLDDLLSKNRRLSD